MINLINFHLSHGKVQSHSVSHLVRLHCAAKSINAVSHANFGIVIGVHPSTLQIKKKKTDQDHSWALLRPENWAYFIKATYRRSQFWDKFVSRKMLANESEKKIDKIFFPDSGSGFLILRIFKNFRIFRMYRAFLVKYFLVIYHTIDFRVINRADFWPHCG